jgi:hypothetical protein
MNNFSKNNRLNFLLKATTAPTSVTTGVDSAALDTSGFNCVTFINPVGQSAVDGLITFTVRGSTASAGTYQALSGASVASTTSQKDGLLVIEVDRPPFRYLKARVASATSDIQHGGVIAICSNATNVPVTQDSTSMLQTLVRTLHST